MPCRLQHRCPPPSQRRRWPFSHSQVAGKTNRHRSRPRHRPCRRRLPRRAPPQPHRLPPTRTDTRSHRSPVPVRSPESR
ncbi:MAG: hypothetical protein E6R06_22675 [Mycobacterium sp.]|nr:MAG: hypothetical protein E6R06_22675 [Mycobacterium sp.]